MRRVRGVCAWLALAGLLGVAFESGGATAADDLTRLETEFEKAIKKVTPATVVCMARDVGEGVIPPYPSSGVMVYRKGLVLSDGDAGVYYVRKKGKRNEQRFTSKIEIRIPNLKGKGFRSYDANVVWRDRKMDTSLIKIEKPPTSGFKYLEIGDSDTLQVGDFTFVMGSSFGLANEAPPTITAGVVSALISFAKPEGGEGAYERIYTSAAVNPGVNGGPLVDVDGRLVGTVSSAAGHEDRFQYLGKCVPVARLRAVYKDRPEAKLIFPDKPPSRSRSRMSAQLETVFHHTGRKAFSGVVSFTVKREGKFSQIAPSGRGSVRVPRYLDALSGVLIDSQGHILTSLYNLTNVNTLVDPNWARKAPYEAKVEPGIKSIQDIRVHFAEGGSAPAKVTGYSEYLGIAMLKADVTGLPGRLEPLSPAPVESYRAGRFVLALGNPFGSSRPADPLLTVGVLSKQHPIDLTDRWAGQWQTDAGCTDANAGGAAVNLRGELVGIMNIWSPINHGRNSGVGFVVPFSRIEPHLEALQTGRRAPYMGVGWDEIEDGGGMRIDNVGDGTPAKKAGLEKGDVVVKMQGRQIAGIGDALAVLRDHWSGDEIVLTVIRDGDEEIEVPLTLGHRESPKPPPKPDEKDEDDEDDGE